MNVSANTGNNVNLNTDAQVTDLQGLLTEQKSQMQANMAYQSESAKMNIEFEMHKASTDRLNAMADSIGSSAAAASRQLAN